MDRDEKESGFDMTRWPVLSNLGLPTVSYAKFSSVYNETFRDLWTGQYQAVIDYYSAPFPAAKNDGSPKLDSTGHLVIFFTAAHTRMSARGRTLSQQRSAMPVSFY